MPTDMVIVKKEDLGRMVVKRLTEAGMGEKDAAIVADILVFAELRGVSSHGVLRVEHYTNRIRAGGINLRPVLKVEKLKPSIGLLDAAGAMGHVAAKFATEAAIGLAREHGMALVGVKNSSHCGALAYYVQQVLDAGMASIVCVNTDKVVVPFGGRQSFFGSNPFAFGFPGERDDILLDMATSEAAWGKILHARDKNQPLSPGWAVDAEGNPTTDPFKAVSLTAFGGHKGYGISVMVEALTGLMIGGVFGPHLKKMYGDLDSYRDVSGFILVIDPSVFGPKEEFLARTRRMVDELHSQPVAEGVEKVMVPGEIEKRCMERLATEGIPVPRAIYDFLSK